jgi:hypothetical protein
VRASQSRHQSENRIVIHASHRTRVAKPRVGALREIVLELPESQPTLVFEHPSQTRRPSAPHDA